MASPTASSPAVAPTTPPPPPAAEAPKTLNPNVFRPVTPPSHHSDDGRSPQRAVSFIFPTVIVLRIVAIALAITLIVLEFEKTGSYHGIGPFPVVLAFFQLFWLVFAVLRDLGRSGGGGNKGFTVDLGFVKCIFGGRGRGREDQDAGEMLLGWVPGDPGRKLKRGLLFTTAADLVFATITFTVGMVLKGGWYWYRLEAIYIVAFVIAGLEIILAIAQHFTILKRARIQISYDEDESEDGLGSHKYRIRLPQSPERGQAPISVYAHTAI